MKCLTVAQPWAWALIHGPKRIENRNWYASYRGPLAIHAGKSRDWLTGVLNDGTKAPPASRLVFGAVIGVVEMVDCRPASRCQGDPFAEGPWCFILKNPRPLPEPVTCRGQLGFFDVPDELLRGLAEPDQPSTLPLFRSLT